VLELEAVFVGFFFAAVVLLDDCVLETPWFIVEELPTEVDCWLAVAPLVTVWLPLPRFTPGLMFAAALTSVLLMPTLASTATLGLTFKLRPFASREALVPVEALPESDDCTPDPVLGEDAPVPEACELCTPWPMVEVEPMLVDCWPADTALFTVWLPEPTFTPGLTFAAALTELFAMPTFASTSTFGFTFRFSARPEEPVVPEEAVVAGLAALELPLGPVLLADVGEEPLVCVEPDARDGALTETPGLTLTAAFTSLLATPTFALTPTFGFTLVEEPPDEVAPDIEDCRLSTPWAIEDDEFTSIERWFAVTLLVTVWLGLGATQPFGSVLVGGLVHTGVVVTVWAMAGASARAAARATPEMNWA
jgi:hypothetical protein